MAIYKSELTNECPFCGCENVKVCTHHHRLGLMAWVSCNHCMAAGSSMVEESREEAVKAAIDAWNEATLPLRTQVINRIHAWLSRFIPHNWVPF